jgi:hypothetical protein
MTSTSAFPTPVFDASQDVYVLTVLHQLGNVTAAAVDSLSLQLAVSDVVGSLVVGSMALTGVEDLSSRRRALSRSLARILVSSKAAQVTYLLYMQTNSDVYSQLPPVQSALQSAGFISSLHSRGSTTGMVWVSTSTVTKITATLLRARVSGGSEVTGYAALPLAGRVLVPLVVVLVGLVGMYCGATFWLAAQKGQKPSWLLALESVAARVGAASTVCSQRIGAFWALYWARCSALFAPCLAALAPYWSRCVVLFAPLVLRCNACGRACWTWIVAAVAPCSSRLAPLCTRCRGLCSRVGEEGDDPMPRRRLAYFSSLSSCCRRGGPPDPPASHHLGDGTDGTRVSATHARLSATFAEMSGRAARRLVAPSFSLSVSLPANLHAAHRPF